MSILRQFVPHGKYFCCVHHPGSQLLYASRLHRNFCPQLSLLRIMVHVSSCRNFYSLSSSVCTRPSNLMDNTKSASSQSDRDKFSLDNETFRRYLDHLLSEYESMNEAGDEKTGKRRIYLTALAKKIHELRGKCTELAETKKLLEGMTSIVSIPIFIYCLNCNCLD